MFYYDLIQLICITNRVVEDKKNAKNLYCGAHKKYLSQSRTSNSLSLSLTHRVYAVN